MSSHHDHNDHHVSESKPVSFGVPMILGLVTMLVILLFVSLGDPCHGHQTCECKEDCSEACMEACEKGDHSMHEGTEAHDAEAHDHEKTAKEEAAPVKEDAAATVEHNETPAAEHHEEAKHE